MPLLEDSGMHQFSAYLTGFLLGLAPLLPVAFVMLSQEGKPMGWASLASRLGLRRFGGRDFAVMLGLTVVAFVATLLTSPTQSWITDLSSWLAGTNYWAAMLLSDLRFEDTLENDVTPTIDATLYGITLVVLVTAALGLVVATKGRLGFEQQVAGDPALAVPSEPKR